MPRRCSTTSSTSEPPPQQDRSRGERAAHPHDSRGRLSAGATRLSGAMRPLSFKTRLWLGHVAVLAVMLAVAAFGADWGLRGGGLGDIIEIGRESCREECRYRWWPYH